MDALTISAASGLRARMESLDMLANNLANGSTSGFKGDREFYSLYVSPYAVEPWAPAPATLPVIERHWTDFTQGPLRRTNNPLDVALSGPGFFVVEGPNGPLYTRNGAWQRTPAGVVVTGDGLPLRLVGGGTITLAPDREVSILPDGTVQQGDITLGQLEIVRFADPSVLMKRGNSYFVSPEGAPPPQPAAEATVYQGHLEDSNLGAAESAVRLISVLRQFEMLQKAIVIGGEMNRKAVEEVAKVS